MLTDEELARRQNVLLEGTPYQAALRAADRRSTASTNHACRATGELVALQQSGFALGWILCWVAAAFAGAILIGENLAQRVAPWGSLEALTSYLTAPLCLFVLLRSESVLGGHPKRLFGKMLPAMLIGTAVGWCAVSPYVGQMLSRTLG